MSSLAALPGISDLFELRSSRMALAELALVAAAGGLLGAWIVLRRLAFFTHAAGTATFPGLVAAEAATFSPRLAALGVALGYTAGVEGVGRSGRGPGDAAAALALVAALALGTILASDLLESGAAVDRLLFGSAVALDGADLAFSSAVVVVAGAGSLAFGRVWTATAFDPTSPPPGSKIADAVLLLLVALAVVSALPAVGALLVTSLFVVPAAIARLFSRSVRTLAALAVAIGLALGAAGLYVSLWADVPPGPAVALLGSLSYGLSAIVIARAR